MAKATISGLTVAIGANTKGFTDAIKEVDRVAKSIAGDLKTVSDSMKLDPQAITSYASKFKLLQEAVDNSAKKVELAKKAIAALDQDLKDGKVSPEEYARTLEALKRQLESAEYEYTKNVSALRNYDKSTKDATTSVKAETQATDKLGDELEDAADSADDAAKNTSIFSDALDKFTSKQAVLGALSKIKDLAIAVARELLEAGKKLVEFSFDAVKAAASYEDALGYTTTIFGEKVGAQVKQWVDDNTNALRIYKGDLLENVNTFGQLFQTMSLGAQDSFEMATNIISLAADLRAATGKDMTDILEALTAGFTTTTRSLRQFGVRINEAEIKAYALDKGIVQVEVDQTKLRDAILKVHEAVKKQEEAFDEHDESSLEYERATVNVQKAEENLDKVLGGKVESLTAAERSTAIYQMILEQLAPVIGQNERESELFNSQLAEVETRFKNLKLAIGDKLLPVAKELLQAVNDFLDSEAGQQMLDSITDQFQKWADTIQGWIESGQVAQFFSDMGERIPQVVEFMGDFINKIIELLPEIEKLVEAMLNLFGIDTEAERAKKAFLGVKQSVENLADAYGLSMEEMNQAVNLYAKENGLKTSEVYENWNTHKFGVNDLLKEIKQNYSTNLSSAQDIIQQFSRDSGVSLNDIYSNWQTYEPQIASYAAALGSDYSNEFEKSIGYIKQFADENGISVSQVLTDWQTYEPQINTWLSKVSTDAADMSEAWATEVGKLAPELQNAINDTSAVDISPMESFLNNLAYTVGIMIQPILDLFEYLKEGAERAVNFVENKLDGLNDSHHSSGGGSSNGGTWTPSNASGGAVRAGQMYQVNDDAGRRKEYFIPAQDGYILNGNQVDRVINNTNNSRTVGDINIYVNSYGTNVAEVADELGAAFKNKMRMSGALL